MRAILNLIGASVLISTLDLSPLVRLPAKELAGGGLACLLIGRAGGHSGARCLMIDS
jgi:hypothetical protein